MKRGLAAKEVDPVKHYTIKNGICFYYKIIFRQ